jgi:hypothetical protein
MKGRALLCIVLGLLAVTPALAPAAERAGDSPMGMPEGWSDDINISNNPGNDKYPEITVSGETVHAVWIQNYTYLAYKKSNDSGRTWGPTLHLFTAVNIDAPDIAVSGQNIHVVCDAYVTNVNRIYYINSTDGGDTWNDVVGITPNIWPWYAYAPNLYVNCSNVHISWHDKRDGGGVSGPGEIYYRRSLDGGIAWDNGQGVDEDRRLTYSPADIGGGGKIAGDGSNLSITWSDERDGEWEVYWMISKDNGFTWEDGLGNIGQDRRLSQNEGIQSAESIIEFNGSNIHIIWVDMSWPGPLYRLYYRNSTDSGVTWETIQLLSGPQYLINSPDIAVEGDDIHIVWDEGQQDVEPRNPQHIFYKNSTDGGISWFPDLNLSYNYSNKHIWPRISVGNGERHVIWWEEHQDTQREIYYKRYPDFPIPTYTIPLRQGWNLLSTPLIPEDEAIDKVLENITGKWDCIQLYNSTDTDHWKTNLTYRPEQLNDLNSLDYKMGFWINITEPGVFLTLKGQIPDNTVIPLYAGWNLVGYPTLNDTMTVGNALWGTGADRVEVFDAADPYRLKDVTSTYVMKPGEGYWIHVVADSTWTINW